MKPCKEVEYCKKLFMSAGRIAGINILNFSNLTDREREVILCRLIKGLTLKECSELFVMEEDSVNKMQKRVCIKLYKFLTQS